MARVRWTVGMGFVLSLAAGLLAAAERPASIPPQGIGQLVVHDAQSGSPVRLNVARYHVHVVLQPPVALVQIDQSFYNPYPRQEEGTFVFNLPRGASVSRFAMYVTPGQLVEGELIERQRASNIYEDIVRRRRDPAILEQIGDNLFKMRVFPIFAQDTKRILLDFTLPLEDNRGRSEFRLPLFSDLQPIWDFQLTGVIRSDTPIESAACTSHPEIALRPHGREASFEWKQRNYRPKGDFAVSFAQKAEEKPSLRSYVAEPLPRPKDAPPASSDLWTNRPASYFLATVRPEPGQKAATEPADVLLLVDTSDAHRDQRPLREAARKIVSHLRPEDRLRLACVDISARFLSEGWIAPKGPEVQAALEKLNRQFGLGGGDLERAFGDAIKTFPEEPSRRRLVIYLGNGVETMADPFGASPQRPIAKLLDEAKAAFFALPIDASDKGRHLLEDLAQASGGLVFGSPMDDRLREMSEWLQAGLPSPEKIIRVEIPGVAAEDLFHPGAWLPGKSLTILGRCEPVDKLPLTLTTSRDGKTRTQQWELAVDARRDDVFVGRLWAQRKLDRLRREEADRPGGSLVRGRIVALSQEWSLLSPYTAFLVLETEQDYVQWKIDRQQRRRYWKPADALAQEPLAPEWIEAVRPKVEEQFPFGPRTVTAEEFDRAIRQAQEALKAQSPAQAYRLLERVKDAPQSATRPDYADLSARTLAGVQFQALLASLGPYRPLVDPTAPAPASQFDLGVSSLFGNFVSPEFARQHPLAMRLLRERPIPREPLSIDDLATRLSEECGINVVVDRRSIEEAGILVGQRRIRNRVIDESAKIELLGWGRMSMGNLTRFALRQLELVMIEEPHRLLITTPEIAQSGNRLATEVYPVGDLLLPNHVPDPGLLSNPYLDREEASRARMRAKMQQPMTVDFRERPLESVLQQFHETLGGTVLVDRKSIEDSGVDLSTPINAKWRDVPAGESLRWILDELELTYAYDGEALMITTPEKAQTEQYLAARFHSARGLVFRYPLQPGMERNGFHGMGGMGMAGIGMGGMAGASGRAGSGGFFGGGGGGDSARRGRAPGMGGMMGGMGGFAGFGGMAGFGDFGASLPGSAGSGSSGPTAAPNQAGLSTGGDPAAAPPTREESSPSESPSAREATTSSPSMADFDSLIELITTTISPNAWDDVGGPGSVRFFEPTFDLVVTATEEMHEQVERLFERMRRLPVVNPEERRLGPEASAPPTVGIDGPDMDSLIEIITGNVQPNHWDDVGGPCSIAPDGPRVALVVSATADIHRAVNDMLTQLHRRRYELLRGDRPWEYWDMEASPARTAMQTSPTNLREPQPEALAALAVRRELADGLWKWRRLSADGLQSELLPLRCAGKRMELAFPKALVRFEKNASVVAYPGLLLAEQGMRGEEIRQMLDLRLPWLPHRSNAELARMFEVRPLPPSDEDARNDAVRLRLGVPVVGIDKAYLEVTFSKQHGLPLAWDAYLDGKLTQRLRFEGLRLDDGPARWETVRLEDPAGKVLGRWELREARSGNEPIPELAAGLAEYVRWDRRADSAPADAAFREALSLLRKTDWPAAARQLKTAMESRPRHPLLLLLWAWCCEQDERIASRADRLAALHLVAMGRAPELTRFISQGNFARLKPLELYELLSLQPVDTRSAGDEECLAQAALAASRLPEALAHTETALAKTGNDAQDFERRKFQIDVLFRLDRREEAASHARKLASRPGLSGAQLLELAVLLDLSGAGKEAAAPCWQVIEMGKMPEDRLGWAARRINQAGGADRVIAFVETRLRSGKQVFGDLLIELGAAYQAAGRLDDARRAATSSR